MFSRELRSDYDYKNLPTSINEDELQNRVTALRGGDTTQVPKIAQMLMRPVLKMVERNCKGYDDEPIGVALLELVEAVGRAQERLTTEDIMTYVMSNVYRRLTDRIPSLYGPKPRTQRKHNVKSVREEFEEIQAREVYPSLECYEILEKIVEDDREALILKLKSEGYTLEELSQKIGVGKTTVVRDLDALERRFVKMYRGA